MANNTTTMNMNAVNNETAKAAEGMFARIKNSVNSFIKEAPDAFADFSKKLNNVANMSDEEAAETMEKFYSNLADEAAEYAEFAKTIPACGKDTAAKNFEGMCKDFKALAAEVKDAKKAGDKVKKALKLVGTALYVIGKKILQAGVAAAKKLLVVGIRVTCIVTGFMITLITKGIKTVKKAFRFGKAYKTVKADEKARKNAPLTVDDLEEEDFEVEC